MIWSSKLCIVLHIIHLVFYGDAFAFTPTYPSQNSVRHTLIQSRTNPLSSLFASQQSKDETVDAPKSSSTDEGSSRRKSMPEARRPSVETGFRYRSDDWLGNFISLPNSFVLRRIRFHLLSNTVITAIVVMLDRLGYHIEIPLVGHSLLGSFLGLLLVFRTNSAYGRFWEARSVWTKTSSTCRSMALSIVNYMKGHSPKSAGELMKLLHNFPDALTYNCLPSGSAKLTEEIQQLVGEEHLKSGVPAATLLLNRMHHTIHEATLESSVYQSNYVEAMHLVEVSHLVGSLGDSVSNADKILRTPVPLSYSRHTSRFLTIWSGTLPLALVGQLGLVTLPVVAITCWCLFGIEEIGHLIEQPFVGDKTLGVNLNWPNNSILAVFPLVSRATDSKPYDIGIPVNNLARKVKEEIKGLAGIAGMTV